MKQQLLSGMRMSICARWDYELAERVRQELRSSSKLTTQSIKPLKVHRDVVFGGWLCCRWHSFHYWNRLCERL